MIYRSLVAGLVCIAASVSLSAQASRDARYEIIRVLIAEQGAARVALPFGNDGVELTETGQINKEKLDRELRKNGQSIETGKVVAITTISFGDDQLEIELDGGGKNKKSIWERIQVGVGSGPNTTPVNGRDDDTAKAKGSKIILKFSKKVPADLTPDQLKELLNPVLDFNKSNFMRTGIASLPPEFQEAVKAKEARIGMDRSTVILALGRPNKRYYATKDSPETWLYDLRGLRALFVTFEDDVVVEIKQY
jgi:hypothetical protein